MTLICLWPNETVPADLPWSSNMSALLSRSCFCVEAEPGLIRTLIRTLTAPLHLGEIRGKQKGELFFFQCLFICLCRSYLSHAGSSIFAEACEILFYFSAVGHVGSLVAAREPSVVARGIWFPDQGWNPGFLHWKCGVLATGPPGRPEETVLNAKV